jgi:hypothetical protein
MAATAEVLDSGRERRRRWPVVAGIAVVLLVLGAVRLNAAVRSSEISRLLTRAASAQDTIADTDARIASTVTYTQPLLYAAGTAPGTHQSLLQLVQDSARAQVAAIRRERTAAAGVHILSWHADATQARTRLVAYLDARLRYLQVATENADVLFDPHPDLETAMARTRAAFLRAASAHLDRRVEAVFAGGVYPTVRVGGSGVSP